jgi:uncharacterized protein YndB with AHSA1/START domain
MAKNNSNEIRITRLYAAPVRAVWDAWNDPEQVAAWWGPRGFTITTHSKDTRPGGEWRFTMHGPDGVDYPNKARYLEVDQYARLVYDHGADDDKEPMFRVTVLFKAVGNKTQMELCMRLATPEAAAETRKIVRKFGGNSTWDRLAEVLEKEQSKTDVFVINRSFEAPIATVFEMWTNAEHFARWLPPTGMTMRFIEADIRAGGGARYVMSDGAKLTLYGKLSYLEIEAPERIVYTQQFCDEQGNISRHPHLPNWPETMLTTVAFAEEASHETRVTVSWQAYGAATVEELKEFRNSRGGMTQGWTGSFDKLEDLLSAP